MTMGNSDDENGEICLTENNELREGRPLHIGAGEPGIGVGMENPPALGLAVCLQALRLGLDGVAFHGLLLRGYADVDGSTRWHDIDLSA